MEITTACNSAQSRPDRDARFSRRATPRERGAPLAAFSLTALLSVAAAAVPRPLLFLSRPGQASRIAAGASPVGKASPHKPKPRSLKATTARRLAIVGDRCCSCVEAASPRQGTATPACRTGNATGPRLHCASARMDLIRRDAGTQIKISSRIRPGLCRVGVCKYTGNNVDAV